MGDAAESVCVNLSKDQTLTQPPRLTISGSAVVEPRRRPGILNKILAALFGRTTDFESEWAGFLRSGARL